ncbi:MULTISPECIES: ATP-binding protein [unclassified Acinetobacter]|uniref:ATP-binding protein n=1 Tax=unclassified Acinetobacter TaxID=196816 RepID=UPI0035B96F60
MSVVKSRRISITLRLFLSVLLITVIVSTLSAFLLRWSIQKNFARYVTQVEFQKLDHLNNNLAEIYQVYDGWQNAFDQMIDQQHLREVRHSSEELEQHLLCNRNFWFVRQYQIAQQQNEILKNPALFKARLQNEHSGGDTAIPSHFNPFGLEQESSHDHVDTAKQLTQKHAVNIAQAKLPYSERLEQSTDVLGLSGRLGLYDANKNYLAGAEDNNMLYQEILVDHKVVGYLALRPSLSADDVLSIKFFNTQQRYFLMVYGLSIILSLIVSLLLAKSFRRPIQKLLVAAQALSNGQYQHHVKIHRNDELGDLSAVINQLADILYQHEQSRRQWVADTSHELKTPLSVLQAQIEAMQDGIRQATPEHLEKMQHQVTSLRKLTQDLADLAQADAQQLSLQFKNTDVWAIVENEVLNFQEKFEQKNMTVEVDGTPLQLHTDGDRLRQIIVNILSNSLRYTEDGGTIRLHVEKNSALWILHIDDSPLGLTDEQLSQLGQRFYRVDDSRTRSTGGTGLGLALSKKIAQLLGGDLLFDHSPLGGLRCSVLLPLQQSENTNSGK